MKRTQTSGDAPESSLKDMAPELRKLGDEIKDRLQRCSRGDLRISYDIGVRVNTAISNDGIYGADAVRQLAQYTAVAGGDRTLLNMAQLAGAYDWSYLASEVGTPMANGRYLSHSHFLLLSRIASKKDRAHLLVRIREENLSIEDVQREIYADYETTHKRSGAGRKLKKPSSPTAGLSRLTKDTEKLVKFEAILDESVFEKLGHMSSSELKANVLEAIERAETATTNAVESMQHILARLADSKAHVEQVLRAKEKTHPSDLQPA